MSNKSIATIATMGIDIGKNWFHVIGLDRRGAIVLRQKLSRGQVEARLANVLVDYGKLPAGQRNILRLMFCDPHVRALQPDWESVARFVMAAFRAEAARAGRRGTSRLWSRTSAG